MGTGVQNKEMVVEEVTVRWYKKIVRRTELIILFKPDGLQHIKHGHDAVVQVTGFWMTAERFIK